MQAAAAAAAFRLPGIRSKPLKELQDLKYINLGYMLRATQEQLALLLIMSLTRWR